MELGIGNAHEAGLFSYFAPEARAPTCRPGAVTACRTKIVEELPELRQDTLELVKKAVGENRRAYVFVNNRSEGNAPLTIQQLRNALQTAET